MIAALAALTAWHSAELGRPVHDGVVQQPASLQIFDQPRHGPVQRGAEFAVIFGEVSWLSSFGGEAVIRAAPHLNETDTTFDETASGETA